MHADLFGKSFVLAMALVESQNDSVTVINLMGDDRAYALLLWLTALGVNDLNKQYRWAIAGLPGALQRELIPQLTSHLILIRIYNHSRVKMS